MSAVEDLRISDVALELFLDLGILSPVVDARLVDVRVESFAIPVNSLRVPVWRFSLVVDARLVVSWRVGAREGTFVSRVEPRRVPIRERAILEIDDVSPDP